MEFSVTVPALENGGRWRNIAYTDGTPTDEIEIVKPADAVLSVEKSIEGREWKNGDSFSFVLLPDVNDAPTAALSPTLPTPPSLSRLLSP